MRWSNLVLFGMLLWLPAMAAAGETWVIAVGVESYGDASITKLQYAAEDATAVAHTFRATGVGDERIDLLVSGGPSGAQPTRSNLLAALDRLRTRTAADDLVVIFFAGHGVEDQGQPYLLLSDTRRALLSETALPLPVLHAAIGKVPAGQVVLLIDACRNDPDAGRADNDAALSDSLARGLRPVLQVSTGGPLAIFTLLACEVGERAWEDPTSGHGTFTARLLEGFRTAVDADGAVRLRPVAATVRRQVMAWAAKAGKRQSPTLTGPEGSDPVLLIRPAEPLVSVEAANQPLADVVAELAARAQLQIVLGLGVEGRLRVTGRLRNQPVTTALRALTAVYGLQVKAQGEVLVVSRGADAPLAQASHGELPDAKEGLIVAPRDGHCRTIAEAVDRAPEGGLIKIRPGVYHERLEIHKSLTLSGDGPRTEIVVVNSQGPCLTLHADQLEVRGLTILQQSAPADSDRPAVAISDGHATMIDCEVVGGSPAAVMVEGPGTTAVLNELVMTLGECGLLARQGCQVTLAQATATTNSASGVRVRERAQLKMLDCRAARNGVHGLHVQEQGDVSVQRCEMTRNRGSGVLAETKSSLTIEESVLLENQSSGLDGFGEASVTVQACRIEGNAHCGVQTAGQARLTILDCRVSRNNWGISFCDGPKGHTVRGGAIIENRISGLSADNDARVTVTRCDIRGNNTNNDPAHRDIRIVGRATVSNGGG